MKKRGFFCSSLLLFIYERDRERIHTLKMKKKNNNDNKKNHQQVTGGKDASELCFNSLRDRVMGIFIFQNNLKSSEC